MATLLATILADFSTNLATAIAVGGTTATLQSATDDDGVALPSGRYFFTIDGDNSNKEHFSCSLSGTSLTSLKSVSRQGVETSGAVRSHRIGATVTITDFAHILQINNLLAGTTDLNSSVPLKYDGTATISNANHLATKAYVDGVAIAGAPDASTTTKGITKMSVAPASATSPIAVGDNDGRVPTQGENDALVGDNTDIAIGSGNKFVSQTGLQHNAEKYAADAGSTDAYAITLSPVPTSYTEGMVVYFKANTVNTGACTINVNSLGVKSIVKNINTALVDGDIAAGMLCTLIYDGTNFVIQNPTSTSIVGGSTYQGTSKTSSTAQSTHKMAGFAGSITPIKSGKILIRVIGDITQNTSSRGASVKVNYGTGSAPADGDADTGTQVGPDINIAQTGATAFTVPYSAGGIVTGLTIGTTYWIDCAHRITLGGGISTLANSQIEIIEL